MIRKDWYTFLSYDEKKILAKEFLKGPEKDTPVVSKLFANKFHATPCPMGYYGPEFGGPPLPSIYERLKEENFLK